MDDLHLPAALGNADPHGTKAAAEAMPACPIGGAPAELDHARLEASIRSTYERVVRQPDAEFHFHTGLDYAVDLLRYDRVALSCLPALATQRFAGVGNPLRIGMPRRGATVLDHACGAGTDLLLAAQAVGPTGKAIGVDLTPAMRDCAWQAARMVDLDAVVDIRAGRFEHLPVDDASVDVVLSNGVVNLAPDKARVFAEIARVLKPGGLLLLADVLVERPLAAAARANAALWAACVGGALTASEMLQVIAAAGLTGGRIVEEFDCFRGTDVQRKFGAGLRVFGANVVAWRGLT